MYILTYLHMYIHTYIHTYITYIHYILTYLHTFNLRYLILTLIRHFIKKSKTRITNIIQK
jgi:hypothetical protein